MKTVLITGANRGLGVEFVEHYVRNGWRVIATARRLDGSERLRSLQPWKLVQLDTSDEASILRAAAELTDVPVDLLINNAGILFSRGMEDSTKADILEQFEVNAVGPFLTTRALLPNLRLAVQERGSAFVAQITSRLGSIGLNAESGYYGYRASKAALNMISTSLVRDLTDEKIAVLMLHPGYTSTDMSKGKGDYSPPQSVALMAKVIARATRMPTDLLASLHDLELRDPTREELFNGPKRDKLPAAIQELSTDETACTFCGVSYFVFAEVQELQATVKKYKQTFHSSPESSSQETAIALRLRSSSGN
ncbi:hypothetical protein P43SY_006378 [Pythium insidiosum]|uniref:Short chain dehydrogenase n=1 Tax=Pythium insidiosum TaxID=114742 RepID=A0AAD5LKJ3_PYTIN|nr:hypothetical protein P43SY_006378 [Pythium insidiosum]